MSLDSTEKEKKITSYTVKLDDAQLKALNAYLKKMHWEPVEVPHSLYAYQGDKIRVIAYTSQKVVIQGKRTEHFVTYILEPEITKDPRLGYDNIHHPEWFEPHAGLDESGKGDLFGPLITACVIADCPMVEGWIEAGLQDSKKMTDGKAKELEKIILKTKGVVVKKAFAGMEKYNELYTKFGSNLNKLLAWFHSKSLTESLKQRRVPWGLLDQFSKQPLVQRLIKDEDFSLQMRTKAEEDPVVAAASVIARAEYLRQMEQLSELADFELRKGASALVKAQAVEIVQKFGPDQLGKFAKLHFKTASEAIQLAKY